jgi:hypothetical protein
MKFRVVRREGIRIPGIGSYKFGEVFEVSGNKERLVALAPGLERVREPKPVKKSEDKE